MKSIYKSNVLFTNTLFITAIIALVLMIIGSNVGALLVYQLPGYEGDPFMHIFGEYLYFIGMWIIFILFILVVKPNRPIFKAITQKTKGNTVKNLLLGFLVGFVTNGFCILMASLHKDIFLVKGNAEVSQLLLLFIAVFIQSSAEELICRGFIFQRALKMYNSPWFAIIGNALLFSLLHILNPGVSVLCILNIFLVGVVFSLIVYYFDSIWLAMSFHAAWNFTQNIIFGLPNSGIVSPVSIFKLDASTARNSFAYNVGFGVEGTIVANVMLFALCIAIYLYGKKKDLKPTNVWN